jgi:hypothetical protein
MLYGSMDPNERFRARRDQIRRRKRRRRAAVLGLLLAIVIAVAMGAQFVDSGHRGAAAPSSPDAELAADSIPVDPADGTRPRPLPLEIRGVHVTGPLASLPGKFSEYVALTKYGLNTIELDVKDEGGEIGFRPSAVPLAATAGAGRPYYKPRQVATQAHDAGIYLIGRVVCFQDPQLARARPDLAVHRPDGSVWTTSAGLAWVNPYDRRVWSYCADVAAAAARAGFDEILFDYVRFPSDGDVDGAVYPGRTSQPRGRVIADFVGYAKRRLEPLGVRVSTAVFGLSATRNLGIGQVPRWMSQNADTIMPMSYPALYNSGELGIDSPVSQPGETVFRTLSDFRRQLDGSDAQIVTWVQDFSGYTPTQVQAQIDAARLQGAKGFLLWNPEGLYTTQVLGPATTATP